MRGMMIAFCIAVMTMIGCARNSNDIQSIDIEQIMKEVQEGQITRKEGMEMIFDARREELEREYKNDRISRDEYARRKVVTLMDESYEMLATSETREHLDAVLRKSKQYNIEITKLLLYKNDGTVSYSNDHNDIGKRIDIVVDGIAVGDKGVHGVDGGEKGNFAMLRPLPNHKGCHRCHASDMRIIGGVYISFGKEALEKIQ